VRAISFKTGFVLSLLMLSSCSSSPPSIPDGSVASGTATLTGSGNCKGAAPIHGGIGSTTALNGYELDGNTAITGNDNSGAGNSASDPCGAKNVANASSASPSTSTGNTTGSGGSTSTGNTSGTGSTATAGASGSSGSGGSNAAGGVTYTANIGTILTNHCTNCHGAGGTLPDLSTYSGASQNANKSFSDISNGTMPKSGTSPLSADEFNMFQTWVSAGAPQ